MNTSLLSKTYAIAYATLAQLGPGGSGGTGTVGGSSTIENKLRQELNSGNNYYTPLQPTTQVYTIGQLIDAIITFILYAAGITATIYLLWAGITYITSAGDEAKATKARQAIVNAIIGIIVIILAFVIEKAVAKLFA